MGGHGYTIVGGTRITYGDHNGGGGGGCGKPWHGWVLFLGILGVIGFSIAVTSVYFQFPKGGPTPEITLGLSETRIVHIKSHWFDRYQTGQYAMLDRTPDQAKNETQTTPSGLVQLMRFSKRPPLIKSDSWNSTVNAIIAPKDYYYWSWYLYKGSSVNLNWKFPTPAYGSVIYTYFIKSEAGFDAFDEWTYYNKYSVISPYVITYVVGSTSNFVLNIKEDDFYFVFFWNGNSDPRNVIPGFFSFTVSPMILDVSKPKSSCFLPCSQHFAYSDKDILVLVSPNASSFINSGIGSANTDFIFTPVQHSRQWVVALLFFGLALGLFASLIVIGFMSYLIHTTRKQNEAENKLLS